jgi:hypothetical protein
MLRKLCSLWHSSGVDRKRVRIYYKKYERMDLIEECKDPPVQDKYTYIEHLDRLLSEGRASVFICSGT